MGVCAAGRSAKMPPTCSDRCWHWQSTGLLTAGFEHYEISSFAQPGRRCRHNETYWLGEEYFAAGPGAARYVGGRRSMNHRSTSTYLRRVLAGQSPIAEQETLPPEDLRPRTTGLRIAAA